MRAVWVNELGGVTFSIGDGSAPPSSSRPGTGDFVAEASGCAWAGRYIAVPRVLGRRRRLVAHRGPARPIRGRPDTGSPTRGRAARAIGAGLRLLHDALPVGDCPFDWPVRARLARDSRARSADRRPSTGWWSATATPAHRTRLIDDAGRCCGHVDLGDLGVADRWADLAVATMSLVWNYAGGSGRTTCFDAYGIEPDAGPHRLLPAAVERRRGLVPLSSSRRIAISRERC